MRNFYSIQVIDLGFKIDHIISIGIQRFEEHRGATNIARFFLTFIRHGENRNGFRREENY